MSVYDYLDREQAIVRLLRSWNDRIWAREHNSEKIAYVRTRLMKTTQSIGSSPVKGGVSSHEEQLINGLNQIDRLEREIREADETQKELETHWVRLTDEERMVLREMYIDWDKDNRRPIDRIRELLHVERSEAYAKVRSAKARLAGLVFW